MDDSLQEIERLMSALRNNRRSATTRESFVLPLPGFEWQEFMGSEGKARWRQVPVACGRAIELDSDEAFDFGRHSHPHEREIFTLTRGYCLFGPGEMQFMKAGESVEARPNVIHSLRMLEAGTALCQWPDLKKDKITIRMA